MVEVVAGIWQLQLPIPSSHVGRVNAYLVQGDKEYVLVDTGEDAEETFYSLKKQLAAVGISFKHIAQIIVTHIHPDHYGLAGRLKQLSQATVALPYMEKGFTGIRYINDELHYQRWLHSNGVPISQLAKLKIAYVRATSFVVSPSLADVTLHGGEIISIGSFNFQVLRTPGHSPEHISLYEATKKILMSGDHILPTITPNIGLRPHSSGNPLDDYVRSLEELKKLDIALVLPGHEQPFTGLQKRIDELIQHHRGRNLNILQSIKARPKTVYQVATEVTWSPDKESSNFQELSSFHKCLAIMEVLAHLESMRNHGKISKFVKDDTTYYRAS